MDKLGLQSFISIISAYDFGLLSTICVYIMSMFPVTNDTQVIPFIVDTFCATRSA
jgi:hypothetical protein